jgi:hypothetical protein
LILMVRKQWLLAMAIVFVSLMALAYVLFWPGSPAVST